MKFIIITLILQGGLYLVAFMYSLLVVKWGFNKKNAIQKREYRSDVLRRRLPLIMLNMVLVIAFSFGGFYFLSDFFIMGTFQPVWMLVVQFLILLLIDDGWVYFFHRLLHDNKYLLRVVHKKHHAASKPFPLDYMFVHPFEWMGGTVGVFIAVGLNLLIFHEINAWGLWIYVCFRNFHEMNVHSGQKSGLSKYNFIMGSTEHHDLHHSKPVGNYGSLLKIWDKVFKTEI